MAKGNFGRISLVMGMEKRLLIGLVITLVVGSAPGAGSGRIDSMFTTVDNHTVSGATRVQTPRAAANLLRAENMEDDLATTAGAEEYLMKPGGKAVTVR